MDMLATMSVAQALGTTFLVIVGLLGVVVGVFMLVNPRPPGGGPDCPH